MFVNMIILRKNIFLLTYIFL